MNNIKNVAVVGHSSKGKTTLCEAMLNVSKVTERMGRIADSNTVSDFDAEDQFQQVFADALVAHDQLEHVVVGDGEIFPRLEAAGAGEFRGNWVWGSEGFFFWFHRAVPFCGAVEWEFS